MRVAIIKGNYMVEKAIPLKQGLKPSSHVSTTMTLIGRKGNSIKTRIETSCSPTRSIIR